MIEHLTLDDIANEIRMHRQLFTGSFLIVEGSTDSRIFENIKNSSCEIIIANSRDNALGIHQVLARENFPGYLVIVDADFDNIIGTQVTHDNLLHTDSHDIETMILQSLSLEKVLIEHGGKTKLDSFMTTKKIDIRSALLRVGIPIGCLRLFSKQKNLNLKFRTLNFKNFISYDLELCLTKLVECVKNCSNMHHLDTNEIIDNITVIANEKYNPWDLCCGHDLVKILSVGLLRLWGTNSDNQVKNEILEKDLRLAYDFRSFEPTRLFSSVKLWEYNNAPYSILGVNNNEKTNEQPIDSTKAALA